MQRATYFVGTGVDRDLQPISDEERAVMQNQMTVKVVSDFGGFTVYAGAGASVMGDKVVFEPTNTVVVLGNGTPREFENLGKFLRETFRQSEVLYTVEEVAGVFSV